jgi:4-hydroxybenzoate polyprenyltransferase
MLSYFKLVRPVNLLILAITQYLVLFFLIRPFMLMNQYDVMMNQFDFALFVLSNVLLAAAGYAINDYFDTDVDNINKPGKNVLLHGVPANHANTLCFILNAVAVLLGFYCSYKVGFIKLGFLPIVIASALYFYALKYKRQFLIGNIVVALVVAYAVLVVWLFQFFAIKNDPAVFAGMLSYFTPISGFVSGFAVFAFLLTLIREIVKDAEDVEGDKAAGCNSLPVKLGIASTKKVVLGIIIFTMLLLTQVQIMLYTDFVITTWYLMVVQAMFVFLIIKLWKGNERADFHFMSTFIKIMMIAGLLATQVLYISF